MKPNSNPSISDELCWDFFVGGDFVLSIFRMEEQWYNLVSTEQPSVFHAIAENRVVSAAPTCPEKAELN